MKTSSQENQLLSSLAAEGYGLEMQVKKKQKQERCGSSGHRGIYIFPKSIWLQK